MNGGFRLASLGLGIGFARELLGYSSYAAVLFIFLFFIFYFYNFFYAMEAVLWEVK